MELIDKSNNFLSKFEEYKNKNRSDIKELKKRLEILNNKEYEVNTQYLDELYEKKNNIIKQFKTNIKRLQKYIKLNEENKFLNNKKYIKQCQIVLNQLNKFKTIRDAFLDELKLIDKKYEDEYEKDIFNIEEFKKKKEKKEKIEKLKSNKEKKINGKVKTVISKIKKEVVSDRNLSKKKTEELKENFKFLKKTKKIENEKIINKKDSEDNLINEPNANTLKRKDSNLVKRKRATKLITQLIDKQNVHQKKFVRSNKKKETKKILFEKKSLIIENLKINENVYIENKNDLEYKDGIQNWVINLESIRFPLINTYLVKAVVKIVDENFVPLTLKDHSILCDFSSEQKEPKFNFKIKYSLENSPCDDIYFIIIFISFYEINKIVFSSPAIWGFSIFHINKLNDLNEIKTGHFQLPIYLPCYLKSMQEELKNLYLKNKLERINISSFLISNFPSNEDIELVNYSSGLYNNIDFDPNVFELALMTELDKKQNINLKSIKYNLLENNSWGEKNIKSSRKINIGQNFNEEIDLFLQLNKSTIIDYTQCFEILEKSFSIDIGVKALINPHKQFSYKIKAVYISLDFKENIKKEKSIFEKTSPNSWDDFIIFDESYYTFKEIEHNTDLILFKIYYQFYDEEENHNKLIYGYSILPIFYNEQINLNGDFLLPIIINKVDDDALKMIFNHSPFTFCNNLANGFIFEFCDLRKSGLLVSIKDSSIKLQNKYDHIDFFKINNMFMPGKLNNFYDNIKNKYEKGKLKKNKANN